MDNRDDPVVSIHFYMQSSNCGAEQIEFIISLTSLIVMSWILNDLVSPWSQRYYIIEALPC